MEIIIGALVMCAFVGLYVLSSALYERVFHKKARYGCSGGCAGCSSRDGCAEAEKGGH